MFTFWLCTLLAYRQPATHIHFPSGASSTTGPHSSRVMMDVNLPIPRREIGGVSLLSDTFFFSARDPIAKRDAACVRARLSHTRVTTFKGHLFNINTHTPSFRLAAPSGGGWWTRIH